MTKGIVICKKVFGRRSGFLPSALYRDVQSI